MMNHFHFRITELKTEDEPFVESFISDNWGSSISVSRGKTHETTKLPGFICKKGHTVIGLVTYEIIQDDCEIVTLDSKVNNQGLGTQLMEKVIEKARLNRCKRVWLITTNDNIKALRFYQRYGFEWVAFYKDEIMKSRKLKPEIPEFGNDGIPIKHEIEFELRL